MVDPTLVLGEHQHPLFLELQSLRASVARFQNEAHDSALKLQRHSLDAARTHERAAYLERENESLRAEVFALRAHSEPSSATQSQTQVQELTLSLRRLSQKLTLTEEALLARTTELSAAQASALRAQANAENAYALGARIRGREEDAGVKLRNCEWKLQEKEEALRMSDRVVREYAALVRGMDVDRHKRSGSNGKAEEAHDLVSDLKDRKAALSQLVISFQSRSDEIHNQLSIITSELEICRSHLAAEREANSALETALGRTRTELETLKIEDGSAAKMVSRYMQFSQSQTNTLLARLSTLQTRHTSTLSTLQTQNQLLTSRLSSFTTQNSHLLKALDELGGEVLKESYGRRREVALRIKMGGREEKVVEGLRRWVRRGEELLARLDVKNDQVRDQLQQHGEGLESFHEMTQHARILLSSLEEGFVYLDEHQVTAPGIISGGTARKLLLQLGLQGLVDELGALGKENVERMLIGAIGVKDNSSAEPPEVPEKSPWALVAPRVMPWDAAGVMEQKVTRRPPPSLPLTLSQTPNPVEPGSSSVSTPVPAPGVDLDLPSQQHLQNGHAVPTPSSTPAHSGSGSLNPHVGEVDDVYSGSRNAVVAASLDHEPAASETLSPLASGPATEETTTTPTSGYVVPQPLPLPSTVTAPPLDSGVHEAHVQFTQVTDGDLEQALHLITTPAETSTMPTSIPSPTFPERSSEFVESIQVDVDGDVAGDGTVTIPEPANHNDDGALEMPAPTSTPPELPCRTADLSSVLLPAAPNLVNASSMASGSIATAITTMGTTLSSAEAAAVSSLSSVTANSTSLPSTPSSGSTSDSPVTTIAAAAFTKTPFPGPGPSLPTVNPGPALESTVIADIPSAPILTVEVPGLAESRMPISSTSLLLEIAQGKPELQPALEVPPHPLLAELARVSKRYDDLQRAFRDCHLALEGLKTSLGGPSTSSANLYTSNGYGYGPYSSSAATPSAVFAPLPRSPPTSNPSQLSAHIPTDILRAALGRLDDYTEDTRVELEIRVGDEVLLAKGYEVMLCVPGALGSAGTGDGVERGLGHEALDNAPTQSEVEKQIDAFVSGTDPSVRKAREVFERKLGDVQHDIACLKRAVHDPESLAVDPSQDSLPSSTSTPSASASSSTSNLTLTSDESHTHGHANANDHGLPTPAGGGGGWASWIRKPSLSPSPAPPSAPPSFGSIMTTPRLRHSPSTGSLFAHQSPNTDTNGRLRPGPSPTPQSAGQPQNHSQRPRKGSFFGFNLGASSNEPVLEPNSDPLGQLGLRVPMPNFGSSAAGIGGGHGSAGTGGFAVGGSPFGAGFSNGGVGVGHPILSPTSPLSMGIAPRSRTVSSSTYMLGLGAGGGRAVLSPTPATGSGGRMTVMMRSASAAVPRLGQPASSASSISQSGSSLSVLPARAVDVEEVAEDEDGTEDENSDVE